MKKKTNFLLVQNIFFSQIASWKRSHDKYSIKELRLVKLSNEFIIGMKLKLQIHQNPDRNSQKLTLGSVALMILTCSMRIFLSIKVIKYLYKDNFEQCQLFLEGINCIFVIITTASMKKSNCSFNEFYILVWWNYCHSSQPTDFSVKSSWEVR